MELETDKAVVEVPSSVTGTVKEIRVKEGDEDQGRPGDFHPGRRGHVAAESPNTAPVEHISEQHEPRLSLQAAIQAEGKTEAQVIPPGPAASSAPQAFAMPEQLGQGCRN